MDRIAARGRDWPPIELDIEPSSRLTALFLILHLAVMAPLPWLSLPVAACGVLMFLIVISACMTIGEHGLRRGHGAIRAFSWRADGRCEVELGDGSRHDVVFVGEAFVHPLLIVIGLRGVGWRRRYLVICCGNADVASSRRLRVRLRFDRRGWGDARRQDAVDDGCPD